MAIRHYRATTRPVTAADEAPEPSESGVFKTYVKLGCRKGN